MRFFYAYGSGGCLALLNKHKPTQKRAGCIIAKRPFAISCLQIKRTAHDLLRTAVEIVSKRGTNLGLELERRDKLAAPQDQHVPLFGRSIETRQNENHLLDANLRIPEPIGFDK